MGPGLPPANNQESGVFDSNCLVGATIPRALLTSPHKPNPPVDIRLIKEVIVVFDSEATRSDRKSDSVNGTMNYVIRAHHLKEPSKIITSLLPHLTLGQTIAVLLQNETNLAASLKFVSELRSAAGPNKDKVRAVLVRWDLAGHPQYLKWQRGDNS